MPATFIAAKFLLEMCVMTLRVDWYLYRVFTINIKGARAILVKKSDLPGFDQKHYNTTYSETLQYDLSVKKHRRVILIDRNTTIQQFNPSVHFDFGILCLSSWIWKSSAQFGFT